MKLLNLLALLPICAALTRKRDGEPHGEMPVQPLSPIGAILAGFSDVEAILNTVDVVVGPVLRNPSMVTSMVNKYLFHVPLASQREEKPLLRADAKRATFRYGPFKMFGQGQTKYTSLATNGSMASLDPKGQGWLFTINDGLCKNCTILSGKPGLAFENGTRATPETGFYVHHILSGEVKDPGLSPVGWCDQATPNPTTVPDVFSHLFFRGFIGNGEDNGNTGIMFTSLDGKFDSGFQIGSDGHQIVVQADFVNYTNETANVFMTLDIEYVDGIAGDSTVTTLQSVTGCKIKSPKASKSEKAFMDSQKFPILTDGYLISAKGHLHNGGDEMVLSINDKEVCHSKATYDDRGNIVDMGSCNLVLPVKRGDWMSMKSVYDLAAHPPRIGADGEDHSHNVMGGMDLMGMWAMTWAMNKTSVHK